VFKKGDRVEILSIKDTGTVLNTYIQEDGTACVAVEPDHPEKLIPKEKWESKKTVERHVSYHTFNGDLRILNTESNPEWADLWEKNVK
jgi:hypothetical protein